MRGTRCGLPPSSSLSYTAGVCLPFWEIGCKPSNKFPQRTALSHLQSRVTRDYYWVIGPPGGRPPHAAKSSSKLPLVFF
ncbi:hypothetical protein EVAR_4689_1 [Eumeta japonica]|uniref:Uncharacterized protein n=1 Tax=Eumeta variegata TaxID=151549 RepID=A0A4C1WLR9_EUMVA|nr:hypothetical protein EVAR_4689_1 [Eumeta japonica]